jgi:hypothetical protein
LKLILFLIVLGVSFSLNGFGQIDTLNDQRCQPAGGVNSLIFNYYSINFTQEQREIIGANNIELLYNIDTEGRVIDFDLNGLVRPDILDSFYQKTLFLPNFSPTIINGVKEGCIYTARFQFPTYEEDRFNFYRQSLYGKPITYSDIDTIIYRGTDIDLSFGGLYHFNPSKITQYLSSRGGINMDVAAHYKGQIFGIGLFGYFNKKKQDLPSQNYTQRDIPSLVFVGGCYGKKLTPASWIRAGLYYSIGHFVDSEDQDIINKYQLDGGAIDLRYQYFIPFHKKLRTVMYGIQEDIIGASLFAGATQYFFSAPELRSHPTIYLGVNFTFMSKQIADYKLKKRVSE